MNADEAQQQNNEQREQEAIEASRKLSHAFKAECKEFTLNFIKWNYDPTRADPANKQLILKQE